MEINEGDLNNNPEEYELLIDNEEDMDYLEEISTLTKLDQNKIRLLNVVE